uniref:Uncharacterized protein n=1 Tax=Arion vulgaris TaxID=1028688 RepID=A0A0B6ZQ33_9EUPU
MILERERSNQYNKIKDQLSDMSNSNVTLAAVGQHLIYCLCRMLSLNFKCPELQLTSHQMLSIL